MGEALIQHKLLHSHFQQVILPFALQLHICFYSFTVLLFFPLFYCFIAFLVTEELSWQCELAGCYRECRETMMISTGKRQMRMATKF